MFPYCQSRYTGAFIYPIEYVVLLLTSNYKQHKTCTTLNITKISKGDTGNKSNFSETWQNRIWHYFLNIPFQDERIRGDYTAV